MTLPIRSAGAVLDHAYGLDSFNLPYKACHDGNLNTVVERAVAILTDRAQDRIRRGLYRRYVEKVEDLFFVRDLVDAGDGVTRFARQDPYLRCSYRSEQDGLEDNLTLLWTLYFASRAGIGNERLRQESETAWRTFAGSMPMTEQSAEVALQRVYARLSDDERPMHGLCRLILENAYHGPCARGIELDRDALHAALVTRWARSAFLPIGAARPHYDVAVSKGFRVNIDTVVFVERGGGGERLAIRPCTVDADLRQIEERMHDWKVSTVLLVAPPPPMRPAYALSTEFDFHFSIFALNMDQAWRDITLLRDMGYDVDAAPIPREQTHTRTTGKSE